MTARVLVLAALVGATLAVPGADPVAHPGGSKVPGAAR
jgi:hypothetical protein